MFDIKSIYEAKSVNDAIKALQDNPEAIVVCGGSDVLIKIREGRLAGASLVSINGIKELQGISLDSDGTIVMRPAATFHKVTNNEIIEKYIPALGFAADQAGGPQLRHVGTIGGNVCNGATSADTASTLLTLNAELEITGKDGKRSTRLEGFYEGPGKVKLQHGELLTAIKIAKPDYEGFGGCYIKYAMRNAMDIATLGCAVHVKLDNSIARIEELRLAFGVAAPMPIRCRKAEEALKGKAVADALCEIGTLALGEVNPRTSWRASKEFREQLVRELSGRALKEAAAKAGGAHQ